MNKQSQLTNYHTHTYLCHHAQGLPIDYVKKAIEKGYREIGISDHGPLYSGWHYRMNMDEFHHIYLKNIEEAKNRYGKDIRIFRGLELEYLEGYNEHYQTLLRNLDYLICGQHVVTEKNTGKHIDIFREMDDNSVFRYQEMVIAALKTGYFKILAHPDVFMFRYLNWNRVSQMAAKAIIEAAIANDVFLEINCNGIRRGEIVTSEGETTYLYPRIEFWRLVKSYPEAKVIIGEDNHALKHVGDNACSKAREFCDSLGIIPEIFLFGDPS